MKKRQREKKEKKHNSFVRASAYKRAMNCWGISKSKWFYRYKRMLRGVWKCQF